MSGITNSGAGGLLHIPGMAFMARRKSPKKGKEDRPHVFGQSGSYDKEVAADATRIWKERVEKRPHEAVARGAYYDTARRTGMIDPEGNPRLPRATMEQAPTRVSSGSVHGASMKAREVNYRAPGIYQTDNPKSSVHFMESEMPGVHRDEFQRELRDPEGAFRRNAPEGKEWDGSWPPPDWVRRRIDKYTSSLQEGEAHASALAHAASDRRGRPSKTMGGAKIGFEAGKTPTGLDSRDRAKPGRRTKYESATPRGSEYNLGVSQRRWEKASELGNRMPDLSDRELIMVQEAQKRDLYKDSLKNAKWTHETRRANLLGENDERTGRGRRTEAKSDRVVFFTTNIGAPNPSVPADSLIGQYIIRKRKKMMLKAGVPKSRLRGEFPAAVRDMHVVELATGVNYGFEGMHGAFRRAGIRVGSKTSGSLEKPVPVGSQIMYNSQGEPLYDAQGNIRYTEGATRRFRWHSPDLGLRIFVG